MENIGPHLLGRVQSVPDDRDFNLADYLPQEETVETVDDSTLRDQAVSYLKKTTKSYNHFIVLGTEPPADSNWGKALSLLAQIGGSTPSPTPPPGTENP
jgi:hypothetical protein